ncbi:MAG: hypothetical protein QNJ31_03565 [Candidatus Caenarcaniphilales bacterium]|nr:hypothetical protein [Candidatus Caenarcaniphilales bacterium]
MVPVPYLVNSRTLRIYLTMCDEDNVGRVGFIDVNPHNPKDILGFSKKPVLDIGQNGTFDDSGVLPACLVPENERLYLFYSAYQKSKKIPYYILSGLAFSEDNGNSFQRVSKVPILERTDTELFLRSAICVMKDKKKYKLWYSSGIKWMKNGTKDLPVYDIKFLESASLDSWEGKPLSSIELQNDEYGLTIPSVWKENNIYKMIYSIRSLSKGYRLGYAESSDGIKFKRLDKEIGIDVSERGWDSEMICFGNIFHFEDKIYLFYCGNHYGTGGFGYAELERGSL